MPKRWRIVCSTLMLRIKEKTVTKRSFLLAAPSQCSADYVMIDDTYFIYSLLTANCSF